MGSGNPWTADEIAIIKAHPNLKRSKAAAKFLAPMIPNHTWPSILAKLVSIQKGRVSQRTLAEQARIERVASAKKAQAALAMPQRAPDKPMSVMQALFGDPPIERSALREWQQRQHRPVSVSAIPPSQSEAR